MAAADAANPPSLSEDYFLKGKDKPAEKVVETPVTTSVEETVVEVAVNAVEETPAVVETESNDSAAAADESSKTSDAAAGESAEAPSATESSDAAPAAEAESADDSSASESAESETVADEEAAEDAPAIKLETAPADFRFPTTNQTRHCFTRYVEFHRCAAAKGEDAPECQKFAKYYRALCPGEWVDRWNEQRENGTFPGPL